MASCDACFISLVTMLNSSLSSSWSSSSCCSSVSNSGWYPSWDARWTSPMISLVWSIEKTGARWQDQRSGCQSETITGEVFQWWSKFKIDRCDVSTTLEFILSNTTTMSLTKRNQKTSSGSRKTSTAKTRLQKLKARTESSRDHVAGSGQYSEAGFRDVRTNYEKDRLLQWVWI